jgi:hypothetical protein
MVDDHVPRPSNWAGPSNSDQLNLLRGGVEDKVPWKLSSLTLYIYSWQEGKPDPGQNPPVISSPMVISEE